MQKSISLGFNSRRPFLSAKNRKEAAVPTASPKLDRRSRVRICHKQRWKYKFILYCFSDSVKQWCQGCRYWPKSLRNVSSILLNLCCKKLMQFWWQNGVKPSTTQCWEELSFHPLEIIWGQRSVKKEKHKMLTFYLQSCFFVIQKVKM